MREIRPSGSEGGGAHALPTPITPIIKGFLSETNIQGEHGNNRSLLLHPFRYPDDTDMNSTFG